MKEPDIEKINKKLAKESERELVKLIQSKINNVKIRPRGEKTGGKTCIKRNNKTYCLGFGGRRQGMDQAVDSYLLGATKASKALSSLQTLNKINENVDELKQGKDIGKNVKGAYQNTKDLRNIQQMDDRTLVNMRRDLRQGKGALPPEKDLNMLERGTYRNNKGENAEVSGYQILAKSPTVIFYKAIADNTIVIAVRGSVDSRDWLRTNTVLPFGRLSTTSRYKEDKKFVGDNLAKYAQGNDVYIVGHSLGGAIANQLQLDFPIIQGGLSFNPAFQPQDYLKKSKVKRKYTEGDPLGKLGRYLPDAEVERNQSIIEKLIPDNPIKSVYSHFLENFESGKVPFTGVMGKHHKLSAFESGKDGGAKVIMDKKAYVKEHKKLIKLLEKAGKEGEEQKKELKKELKKGGVSAAHHHRHRGLAAENANKNKALRMLGNGNK